MSTSLYSELTRRQRKVARRIAHDHRPSEHPVFTAANIHYDLSRRIAGLAWGGIGAIQLLVRRTGFSNEVNRQLHLLKVHLPYHESDHVLNIPYNILADGTCLQDLDTLRINESFLNALGAKRIPDPTTAGDFCRRFAEADIWALQDAANATRVKIWRQQPKTFLKQAILDADGTLAPTTGQCKQGMDIGYDGTWGYHALVVSLANTKEPLCLVNRPGNRPSHEGAAACFDRCINLCRGAGFASILLRGDTDFSQTKHLDGWNAQPDVQFLFGLDAKPNMNALADALPQAAWKPLDRPAKYQVRTQPRQRPENVKEQVVRAREFENIRLVSEEVAEFRYRPTACKSAYRVVVLKKNLVREKGQERLFPEPPRYFFYITNLWDTPAEEVVFLANDRCDQENLLAQLKNGVQAMKMPLDNLRSNWAYMVMAALAWSFKAWLALSLHVPPGRWSKRQDKQKQALLRMEFKGFRTAMIRLPCQILTTGRKVVYRLLGWSPWADLLLRAVASLRTPLLN